MVCPPFAESHSSLGKQVIKFLYSAFSTMSTLVRASFHRCVLLGKPSETPEHSLQEALQNMCGHQVR